MPKTALYKDNPPLRGEHKIGFAGEGLNVQTESVSKPMCSSSDDDLWVRVRRPDAAHVFGTLLFGKPIHYDCHSDTCCLDCVLIDRW